jgi:hypothetical protein
MPELKTIPASHQHKQKQWVSLAGFFVVLLIVNGTIGWLGVRYATLAHDRGLAAITAIAAAENAARAAQVEFKVQVQEWKNILLRGHDPDDFAQFRQAFEGRERAVEQRLNQLAQAADQLAVPVTEIVALERAHQELGQAYRAALTRFAPALSATAYQDADTAVRGQDRALDRALDALAEQARQHGAQVTHDLQRAGEQRARRIESLAFIGTLVSIGLLLAMVFLLTRRN